MTVRTPLCAVLALFLAGCNTDTERMGQVLVQSLWPREGVRITRERAEEVPFASMGVELGDSDQAMVVLGSSSALQAEWYGGDVVMIRTRAGRIVRTAGLPYDLGGLDLPPLAAGAAARGATLTLIYDFPDLGVFGATGYCTERDGGPATIEILGTQIATRRHVEDCQVQGLNWNFEAEYWKDPVTNYVWRSRQYIHPKGPPVTLEVFRPELPPGG